jgi:hypothetical protein
MIEGRVATAGGLEGLEPCSPQLQKSAEVFLANASSHKSQAFRQPRPQWGTRGLMIQEFPPYRPALHLSESLWRFMPYDWRPFSAYVSWQCLLQSIEDILQRFGTEYTMAFDMK